MSNFHGHIREADEEWSVEHEWGQQPNFVPRMSQGSSSRRIDMAAQISGGGSSNDWSPGKRDLSKDLSNHTQEISDDSHDISTEEEDKDDESDDGGIWCCLLTPCITRCCVIISIVLIVFFAGLGTGIAVKAKENRQVRGGVAAANTAQTSAEDIPYSPAIQPSNAPMGSNPSTPSDVAAGPVTSSPTPMPSLSFYSFVSEATLVPGSNDIAHSENTPAPQPAPQAPPPTPQAVPVAIASPQTPQIGSENASGSTGSSNSRFLVGVYYYPWHGSNFHNGDGYVRNQLQPPQYPELGEYDDSKSETITQHLNWSRQANIGLWVSSWWGPNRLEDTNTRYVIMDHEDIGDMKIALHYETTGRIRGNDLSNVKTDIEYMCETYFDHPNYYKIDGRPVLVVYVTRKLEALGILEEAVLTMRSSASRCGHDIYLIGDHVFQNAPEPSQVFLPFWYFDAVTNYDVYGSMGRPSPYAGQNVVDNYYREQEKWRTQAIEQGCRFVPAVSPGYNDRGVRLQADHPPLSRKLSADAEEGTLFAYAIEKAKQLVDPNVDNLFLVNSFNEWHEDTQIEPVASGYATTNLPNELTNGVNYEGYGDLYLNILRTHTLDDEDNVFENLGV